MKRILKLIKQKWPELLIEIFVIIIGIIGAFMLESYRESRSLSKLEDIYLKEILINIKSDKEQLANVIETQLNMRDFFLVCAEMLSKPNIDNKMLGLQFGNGFEKNDTFFPHDGGYLSLLSEGGMKIIGNKSLSSSITNLYEHWYQRLIYNGEVMDQRISSVLLLSQDYYIQEVKRIYVDDIKKTNILPNIYYIIRSKKVYLQKAESTLEAIEDIESSIEYELKH